MDGVGFEELKRDIVTNGLREAIWLHPDGSIIDGRNRHRACIETGIEPRFRTWDGKGSLVTFILSMNLHRRHLNETQRGIIAYRIENMSQGRPKKDANLHLFSRDEAARMVNVSPRTVATVAEVAHKSPSLISVMEKGELTAHKASKDIRAIELDAERKELAQSALSILPSERYTVKVADIRTYQTDKHFDFIITDPPYPLKYLPLYDILARRSLEWLNPMGLLIVMVGQSYLDQVMQLLGKHLKYYWTGCYLTPGQPTPLKQKQVNTTWKPILIYSLPLATYSGKIFGDVWTSERNEKEYHRWGQSVSGMFSLIEQICLPGQTIFDPFCGAGTTGVAALKHGCFFDGIDTDEQGVNITRARLEGFCDKT